MPTALKVVLRFLWYIFSRLLVWAAAAGLVVLAFFAAMDYMNVRILTGDGLQARAEVVIKGDDPTTLSKVFSKGFLEQDTQLSSQLYRQYIVSDFDYDIDIGFALILPWQKTTKLRVTEKITDIKAQIYVGAESTENISETPPPWVQGIYDVTLVRYEDNWRIINMELIELLPQESPSEAPSPSPTPSQTPASTATPTNTEEIIED